MKGKAVGIENAIRFFLDIDITAITPFNGTTLLLGESELGVDWELGPSDQFARYAFDVDIPLSATERSQSRAIADYLNWPTLTSWSSSSHHCQRSSTTGSRGPASWG